MTTRDSRRRPKGDAKGNAISSKDDQAARKQREARVDLVERMRKKMQ